MLFQEDNFFYLFFSTLINLQKIDFYFYFLGDDLKTMLQQILLFNSTQNVANVV